MKTKKYPLVICAIISLVIIVLTAIFSGIFGVNTSIEIGGGSQVEVEISTTNESGDIVSNRNQVTNYVKEIKNVLKKHSASVDNYVVEDKDTGTFLIIRISKSNIKNSGAIKAEIASALDIDEARVSDVQKISSYFSSSIMLYIGLSVLAILILCFFGGWIRYGIMSGISLMFAVLHNLIISMAVVFLTRVQFSMISLCAILVMTVISAFVFSRILESVRANKKSSEYANLSSDQMLMLATKQNRVWYLFAALALVISVVFVCTPIAYIQLAGLSMILITIASAYSTIIMSPAIDSYLQQLYSARQKQKLSKNKPQTAK